MGHQVGVAPDQIDLVHRDAGLLVGQHAPRRDVALAVRRCAGEHDGPAIVEHLDLGVLAERVDPAGDLDIDADTDAELLAGATCPPRCLLGSQRRIVRSGEHLVERPFEVADVVGLADHGGVRLGELGDQVLPSQLDRIHAELGGEHVHQPLRCRGRLGSSGSAVRSDRCRVGDDARGSALDVGDVVDRRRHRSGHEWSQDGADLDPSSAVLDGMQAVVGDLAVPVATHRDVLDLAPAVAEGHHRLGSVLSPPQRTTDTLRQHPEEDLFGVARDLGAEAATNIGGDDPQLLAGQAIAGHDRVTGALCPLCAEPLVQPGRAAGLGDPGDRRSADLEWAWRDALVDEPAGDDDGTIGEVLVTGVVGHAERHRVEHHVAAGALVEQRGRDHCYLGVDQRFQHVVVDNHLFEGIFALLTIFGDDRGDRLADESHLVDRQHAARRGRVER